MPFCSKARSVPDYLSLRFDEKTRGFNAIHFRGDDRNVVRDLYVRDGIADSGCISLIQSSGQVDVFCCLSKEIEVAKSKIHHKTRRTLSF